MAEDVEGYIRTAATRRGIDPDIAVRVARSEGGLVPNRTGSFPTGKSFWPFQLHYGGAGTPYASFGTVAGMGNAFTAQTGWQPGDPNAWRAATDYALDQARQHGWGQWYGARNVGITGFQGISRSAAPASPAGNTPSTPAGVAQDTRSGADAPAWYRDLTGATDLLERRGEPVPERRYLPEAPADGAPAWYRELLGAGAAPAAAAAPAGGADRGVVWPVAGQPWGKVNNPFGGVQSRAAGATVALPASNVGADLTANYGAALVAPVSGTVVQVYDAPNESDRNLNGGWGGMTLLQGDNGLYYRISHQKPGSLRVAPGQRVAQGQQLGQVGVSGNATGPHADVEVFDRPGHFFNIVDAPGGRTTSGPSPATALPGGAASGGDPQWYRDVLSGGTI